MASLSASFILLSFLGLSSGLALTSRSAKPDMDPVAKAFLGSTVTFLQNMPGIHPKVKTLLDAVQPLVTPGNSRRRAGQFASWSAREFSTRRSHRPLSYRTPTVIYHSPVNAYDWTVWASTSRRKSSKSQNRSFNRAHSANAGTGVVEVSGQLSADRRSTRAANNILWKVCCDLRVVCSRRRRRQPADFATYLKDVLAQGDDLWDELKKIRDMYAPDVCCQLNMACPTGVRPSA